jgi:hypothetical protein
MEESITHAERNRIKTSILHLCYQKWSEEKGLREMPSREFVSKLRKKWDIRRDGVNGNVIVGFALKIAVPPRVEESKPMYNMEISTDFVSVAVNEESWSETLVQPMGGILHIKAGGYEIAADAEYPMEKLAELLRGLGVEGEC